MGGGRDAGRCTISRETNSAERRRWIGDSAELQRRGVRLVSREQDGKKKEKARVAKSKMKVDGEPEEEANTKLPLRLVELSTLEL